MNLLVEYILISKIDFGYTLLGGNIFLLFLK